MKRHFGIIILALLVLVILLVYTVAFVVDQTRDIVIVTRFGKVHRVIDGKTDPGLHFKWAYPVENMIRYDSRDQILISSYKQFNIGEKYSIMASVFCTWKITDPVKFNSSRQTVKNAQESLTALLNTEMGGQFGKVTMDELVNTDPKAMKLEQICGSIRTNVNTIAAADYGIEITDLGVNRIGLPQSVSTSVITAMSEERSKEISKYQAEGQAIAEAIVSRASSAKEKILAFAQRKAGDIRTQGETKAAESYAKFNADPEFSMFLRSVESLRASLKDRSVFLLDAQTLPVLEWLKTKPTLDSFKEQNKK